MDQDKLILYRIEELEKTICDHETTLKEHSKEINEVKRLVDRVDLKLDNISDNLIQVKSDVKEIKTSNETELKKEVDRPKILKWQVLGAIAISIVSSILTLLLK